LADLKGGTSGQVLSKNSNTDMDFVWVTSDDANAIQNAIVDAKGDLIAASANDTPARLAVGNDGETLVADSSTSTGLRYQGNFAAGKNRIINGDFGVWQRGTSFTNPANSSYTADRFTQYRDGTGTIVVSQQAFTPGSAPVAGYENPFFYRFNQTVAGTGGTYSVIEQRVEDVRTFAGQTATFSFWAKADSARTITPQLIQSFGSGGSLAVFTSNSAITLTTSWARYTTTFTVPSVAGKTIGAGSYLSVNWNPPMNTTQTLDTWGWQLEAGSTATAFQTATGTIQGELAACQRYYFRYGGSAVYEMFGAGQTWNNTNAAIQVKSPVTMRVPPTSVDYSTLYVGIYGAAGGGGVTSLTQLQGSRDVHLVSANVTPGNYSSNTFYQMFASNSTSAYIGFSAEL
jgi:hypothetical protein